MPWDDNGTYGITIGILSSGIGYKTTFEQEERWYHGMECKSFNLEKRGKGGEKTLLKLQYPFIQD